ncbi:exo-beta-N-acetylmuramidase NamZ family protein [Kribbella sp. CA-294648]|uniref:exo-beta-N-acetylmuramidase NamZ family protein n=1 Tax=Kribbella sp. CA-294648 TaxID=3239948 RepID=UPI003D8C326C
MTVGRRIFLAGAGAVGAAPLIGGTAAHAVDDPAKKKRKVKTGAQVLADSGWAALAGQKVGVFSNPTGVLADGSHIVDAMHAAGKSKVELVAAFGPEHGFRGAAQAGGSQGDHRDPRTDIMVYDAYGANAAKLQSIYTKAGVETVVFDIQDVGVRFYTYIWSMYEAMVAAAKMGLRFVVLDRPNPIGGAVRGPLLKPGYTSGVGKEEIILQHGMTVGELARLFNAEYLALDTGGPVVRDLEVIELEGWRRDQLYTDTGLTWVMPSPNMPTPDTALLYPGTCLFEATNMSEGRGTTRPFELIGAPYVDYQWADALRTKDIPGIEFREAYFTPFISKNANTPCGGVQVHISDPDRVDPILAATHMMVEAKRLYPTKFSWRTENPPGRWIDLLTGSDRFRTMFTAGATAEEIVAAWRPETRAWTARRAKYLLYKGDHR